MMSPACPELEALERIAAGESDLQTQTHLSACESCRAIVQRIRSENELLGDFVQANAARLGRAGAADLPKIAGYEIRREIHRGAQGIVYEALQQAAHRHVAIKTLLPGTFRGEKSRVRFEREVETVARLRHPNIVTLYERGVTADGHDYLSMELVDGAPLDAWAESVRGDGASRAIPRLLDVFARICDAVSAAHQRGVIHRDLKPANILVDRDNQPRVLDFGLARQAATEASDVVQTVAGEFLGTFAYAAPEQVSGDPRDIDVRADVYALGVILYEMLAGERPYALIGSLADVVQTILNQQPQPPSRINAAVDSELDAIALKALRKEPGERYSSAAALLDDVRHYLAGEPINARRDSQWYLVRKMIRRHRVPLSAAAAIFIAAIVTAGAMFVLKRQADEANVRTRSTLMSLLSLLESDRLWNRVTEATLPNLLAEADEIAAVELAGQPEIEADVRTRLGEAFLNRDSWDNALAQFEQSLALRRSIHPPRHPSIAESLHNCARAYWFMGDYSTAESLYRQALAIREAYFGAAHDEVAQTKSHIAATLRQQGRYDEAERLYRDVLSMRRTLHGSVHADVAASLNNLGVYLRDARRCDEAIPLFEESLAMIRTLTGPKSREVAFTLHNLATCREAMGDLDRAEADANESLDLKEHIYEPDHSSIAATQIVLGRIALQRGRIDEAAEAAQRALEIQEQAYNLPHKDVADSLLLLARTHLARGQSDQAAPQIERAIEILENVLPANHWEIAEARVLLDESHRRAERAP